VFIKGDGTVADYVGDGMNGIDCLGHGTAVASIIGGNVQIYALRVLDCSGAGSSDRYIQAVDDLVLYRRRPAVVNMSVQAGYSLALNQAVDSAFFNGLVFTVAAGNGDGSGNPINLTGNPQDPNQRSPATATNALTVSGR